MVRYADNTIVSEPGNPIHVLYKPVVGDDGSIDLVEAGKENTDDIIASFADSCDIQTILSRVQNGEVGLLNQREGMYGDFVDFPKTYAEVLQLQIDSAKMFNNLPQDVRMKFDNDPNKFFVQAGSAEWVDKLGDVLSEEVRELFAVKNEVKVEGEGE